MHDIATVQANMLRPVEESQKKRENIVQSIVNN